MDACRPRPLWKNPSFIYAGMALVAALSASNSLGTDLCRILSTNDGVTSVLPRYHIAANASPAGRPHAKKEDQPDEGLVFLSGGA